MTRVFGVMGYPISHSLSPIMHNAAFQSLGLEAIYAPFEVPPRQVGPILRGLVASGIDGLNVTVPLKETVLPYLHRLEGEARILRAVNTLLIRRGRVIGYNTDAAGFLQAVKELGWKPRPCAVLILGAGGAAKAVAWALSRYPGIRLTIANRHLARAKALAKWLTRVRPPCTVQARSLNRVAPRDYTLLINATSVGMRKSDGSVIDLEGLTKHVMVYDVVYHRPTALVREARRRGCLAANGGSMLVYQGAESFRLWWHRQPPIDVMRRAVEQALRQNSP